MPNPTTPSPDPPSPAAAPGEKAAAPPAAPGQPLTDAELRHWAAQYAADATTHARTGSGAACVIFRVGSERFAVPLGDLDEVACVDVGIGLSHTSPLVLGLVNIRGEVVPMLDTAAALGTRSGHRLGNSNRSLVVRDASDRRTALPVDHIESIELLPPELFRAQGDGDEQAPIRRIGIAEHAGGSLTLLDLSGLRRAGADASF